MTHNRATRYLRIRNIGSLVTDQTGTATVAAHETEEDGSVVATILEAVADRQDVPVGELPPLYEAVDPDALRALFAPTEGGPRSGRVEFTYDGHVVTVVADRDGSVSVSIGERTAVYRWFSNTTSGTDAPVSLD